MAVWAFAQMYCGEDSDAESIPLGVGIVVFVLRANPEVEGQRLVPRATRKAGSHKTKVLNLEHELEFEGEQLAIGPHAVA